VANTQPITEAEMQAVFDAAKTPKKHGVIIKDDGADCLVDCPSVFRHGRAWYMIYAASKGKIGYETKLARSDDLLKWEPLGTILPFREGAWDCWQADGGVALIDPTWGGSAELGRHNGHYWMSYLGGALQGYETDPLSIGVAYTDDPTKPAEWNRFDKPVLSREDPDVRDFERATLYKSNIIRDPARTLGHEFVMYYNGKQAGKVGTERIGMAVSHDMLKWKRFGAGPVIDNGPRGISGDPQIVRMPELNLWVMFYFGHVWKPKAFDTFAVSRDLVNWTTWQGPHLIEPTEPFDSTFAHKPWMIKHEGVVYHYYCAVGDQGRVIAVATSE
jgi:beta-xylosidase